jgi:hypothetical protein
MREVQDFSQRVKEAGTREGRGGGVQNSQTFDRGRRERAKGMIDRSPFCKTSSNVRVHIYPASGGAAKVGG